MVPQAFLKITEPLRFRLRGEIMNPALHKPHRMEMCTDTKLICTDQQKQVSNADDIG